MGHWGPTKPPKNGKLGVLGALNLPLKVKKLYF